MPEVEEPRPAPAIRIFSSGATRDLDEGKLDYEGFLSPLVLQRYAQYMHKHRVQTDGSLRTADNWTKGMPRRQYMKSLWRHFMDVWMWFKGVDADHSQVYAEEALCATMFNTMGLLHEVLIGREVQE